MFSSCCFDSLHYWSTFLFLKNLVSLLDLGKDVNSKVNRIPILKQRTSILLKCTLCNLCSPSYTFSRMMRHYDQKHKNPVLKKKRTRKKPLAPTSTKELQTLSCHICGKLVSGQWRVRDLAQHIEMHMVMIFKISICHSFFYLKRLATEYETRN